MTGFSAPGRYRAVLDSTRKILGSGCRAFAGPACWEGISLEGLGISGLGTFSNALSSNRFGRRAEASLGAVGLSGSLGIWARFAGRGLAPHDAKGCSARGRYSQARGGAPAVRHIDIHGQSPNLKAKVGRP